MLQLLLDKQNEERAALEARRQKRKNQKKKPLRDPFTFELFPKALEVAQRKEPLTTAKLRFGLVIMSCYGVRIGQILEMTIGQLRELWAGTGTKVRAIKTSADKEILMPRTLEVKHWLQKIEADINILLNSGKDENLIVNLSREHYTREINKILDAVIPKPTMVLKSHSMRINMINTITQTQGIEVARVLANHSTISTTQKYVRTELSERKLRTILKQVIPTPKEETNKVLGIKTQHVEVKTEDKN